MPFARHITLTPGVVTTVTLTAAENFPRFEVLNRNGAGEVYVSHDGTTDPPNPTVGGNDFDVVPGLPGASLVIPRVGSREATIDLISAVATAVSIRGIG